MRDVGYSSLFLSSKLCSKDTSTTISTRKQNPWQEKAHKSNKKKGEYSVRKNGLIKTKDKRKTHVFKQICLYASYRA